MKSSSFLLSLFMIIKASDVFGQGTHRQSTDCPGNLQWSKVGKTIIGNNVGSGVDQLNFPGGLFIEPKTQILYVADIANNRVQKRYPNGKIETAAGQVNGESGTTSDKLWGPTDVVADENENVFVSDWNNQRIQYWEKNAKHGRTVAGDGNRGSGLGEFSYPSRVIIDSKKNIIVADLQNQRVTQWPFPLNSSTTTGTIIAGGNGAGLNPYQLNNPTGLYLDESNGILYISNEESHSVTQWIIGDYEPRYVYAGIPGRPGDSPAQLNSPQGLTFDSYGNLYITDCSNNRIQMFCPNAVFGITIIGSGHIGNSSEDLYFPRDVALDTNLNLYVTDTYNNRIQMFERIH